MKHSFTKQIQAIQVVRSNYHLPAHLDEALNDAGSTISTMNLAPEERVKKIIELENKIYDLESQINKK